MNYKQALFYFIAFILGVIVAKTIKVNVSSHGCPLSRSKKDEIKRLLNSDSSEDYI